MNGGVNPAGASSPLDASWRQTIAAMHASGRQVVLAITGGGSAAIAELLRVPGGSRLLLEAVVPYDARALTAFLGFEPAQASSVETAVAMARRSRERAAMFARTTHLVGLGATAGLVTDRPRQGEHRCHIAVATSDGTDVCSIVLAKGRRDRPGEEDLVARAIVLWLARACKVVAPSPRVLLDADESCTESSESGSDPIDRLLAGVLDRVTAWPDGQLATAAPAPTVVLAGSFNPLHEGHLLLARVAEGAQRAPAAFEISVINVDKPPLAAAEVRARLAQFAGRARVELTRAPTFLEKSRLFPGATFVVGADTAERLVAARYYGDDAQMAAALREIADRGCRFLVAVRADGAGRVRSLADIAIPPAFAHLFTAIPENRFRLDSSSSAIRARRRAP
jgi:nicotinic acid mononucleotide adenylyltransferase/nicotinamide mononucleotide (NMN) deamidase PncC